MVYVGEIVNTHGIKGELKIISDFKYKDNVFVPGMKIYLGKRCQEEIIKTYRKHKNFDMITLEGINDINDAIVFKTDNVYVKREDLNIDGYVDEDIIGLPVYTDEFVGEVFDILKHKQEILVIKNGDKTYLVPFVAEFVSIDLKNKRINLTVIEGLLDEN